MSERVALILITGPPGIGKTTLVRKICEDLVNKYKILCTGFYTEEVLDPNTKKRIGFDIVTLNKKRGILARTNSSQKGPFVGKYYVNIREFENIVLPLVQPSCAQGVLVIDEVGKMELKSKMFELSVENCIMKTVLLATVPNNFHQSLHLVDKLKNHPKAQIIVVTKENRHCLQSEITNKIMRLIELK